MEPASGIEPPTYGLRNRCSTTELRRHWREKVVMKDSASSRKHLMARNARCQPIASAHPFGASVCHVRAKPVSGSNNNGNPWVSVFNRLPAFPGITNVIDRIFSAALSSCGVFFYSSRSRISRANSCVLPGPCGIFDQAFESNGNLPAAASVLVGVDPGVGGPSLLDAAPHFSGGSLHHAKRRCHYERFGRSFI